jgi:hypothetical protein
MRATQGDSSDVLFANRLPTIPSSQAHRLCVCCVAGSDLRAKMKWYL